MQIDIPNKVKKATDDWNAGIVYEQPTIVGAIMESDLSAEEKKPERVAHDALAVVGAGTETTAWALAVITYHLKMMPEILNKLTDELQQAVPDPKRKSIWRITRLGYSICLFATHRSAFLDDLGETPLPICCHPRRPQAVARGIRAYSSDTYRGNSLLPRSMARKGNSLHSS